MNIKNKISHRSEIIIPFTSDEIKEIYHEFNQLVLTEYIFGEDTRKMIIIMNLYDSLDI